VTTEEFDTWSDGTFYDQGCVVIEGLAYPVKGVRLQHGKFIVGFSYHKAGNKEMWVKKACAVYGSDGILVTRMYVTLLDGAYAWVDLGTDIDDKMGHHYAAYLEEMGLV